LLVELELVKTLEREAPPDAYDSGGFSEKEHWKRLETQRKNGKKAEEKTVQFEKERLKHDHKFDDKTLEKVKRPQNKEVKQQNMDRLMKVFRSQSSKLVTIFDMQNLLVDAKDMIIRKLEKAKGVASTFVRTSKGYKVTQPEGFVAIDQVGKAVKLVDRLEFAHQNFNVAKNWSK